ncbi:MAG: DUF5666 domain-containing protein, partial [Chloroflexota bacterium]|nr:DUF5666 domain-containing protein [Chloroflexota bacterium]
MSERCDQILDECIDRVILEDETVEACLARYPEYAAELEGPLRLAVRASSNFALTPTPVAKERGRQRLQAELEALRQADERKSQRRASWFVRSLAWPLPRWAVAAASIILSIVLGGAATAAASSGALPGDTLYPVKRATEEAGLAFQLSDKGKAALHLAYAERRSQEISVLLERGDTTQVGPALSALQENLTSATRIATTLRDEGALASLESQVNERASVALNTLQTAVQNSPESTRQRANDLFQTASESYGETVTAVAAVAPPRFAAAGPGILEIRAMDPPPPGIDKILVEVGEIEVYLATGSKKGWVTVTQSPQTFDLLQIVEVQRLLGEQKVEPGTYTKVRFSINKATVMVAGVEHEAKVPSGRLELARPLRVEEGKRTVVLLDFDSAASLRVTGRDQYTLVPRVTVLAHEPGQEKRQPDKGKEKERDDEGSKGQGKGPQRPEAPQVRVDIDGVVEALTADSLVVRGKPILITASTEVKEALEKGRRVKVRAVSQPDGTLIATKIDVEKGDKGPPEKAPEKPADATVEIQGVVESISPSRWVVAGREVRLTPDTKIKGAAAVGGLAHITGLLQADGAILATEIVAKPPEPGPKGKEDRDQGKQGQPENRDRKDKDQGKEGDAPKSKPPEQPGEPALVRL